VIQGRVAGAINNVKVNYSEVMFNWVDGQVNLHSWLQANPDEALVIRNM